MLSGLLAEEDDLDRRAMWRIGSWGAGAVGAVILAVMANQAALGWKRDQVASIDFTRQAQQIQTVTKETQNEARRLASAIDTLNGDRDRLYTRVTTVEQGLDSVTGAIARQGSAASSPSSQTPASQTPAQQTPATTTEMQAASNPAAAPLVGPVATTQAAPHAPEKPAANKTAAEPSPATVSSVAKDSAKSDIVKSDMIKSDIAKAEAAKAATAKSEAAKSDAAKSEAAKIEAAKIEAAKVELPRIDTARTLTKASAETPSAPLVASQSMMAPPDPAAAKLIEPSKPASPVTASPIPEVMASVPAMTDEEADEATAPKAALQRTEFGVDLGSANSLSGLRALWRGLLKSRSNAPLTALRPIIVVKEGNNGLGMQLRLVAGPLNDAGAAAKICAALTENNRSCETAIFDGQRLSIKSDDPAQATTKPGPRKRGASKRANFIDDPPKKPPPSITLSSFFGRKNSQ